MAVFTIEKINYVVTGSSEQLINVQIKEDGENKIPNRNLTFATDVGPDEEANHATQGVFVSASYKTHRLWKLFRHTTDQTQTENGEPLDINSDFNNIDCVNRFNAELEANTNNLNPRPMPMVTDCTRESDTLVYAMFDVKDVVFKSGIKRKIVRLDRDSKDANIDDAGRYVDVYSPRLSDDFLGFVQYHDAASMGMTRNYVQEPYMQYTTLRGDRGFRLSNDSGKMIWNYMMDIRDAQTFTYTPISDLRVNSFNVLGSEDYDPTSPEFSAKSYYEWLKSFGDLSAERLSSLFEPKYNLSGIPRNYIANMDMAQKMYNDFNSGVMTGDFIYSKNPYNAEYSMHMPGRAVLSGVRKYVGIGTMGGKPFLKYYDDNTYVHDKREDNDSIDPRLSPDFPYDTITVDKKNEEWKNMGYDLTVQDVPMREAYQTEGYEQERKYQNVEFFESMNRGLNSSIHKSNLYSVKIKNLQLDSTGMDDNNLKIIKQDIKNTVRKICERLQPAHTQLFNVNLDSTNSYIAYVPPTVEVDGELRLEFDNERGSRQPHAN